ncbi:MAG: J domain-containing protein [Proteobacteria bacterium]|nr:J domain-containing protein [Pseudomonadota bacterium]
MDLNQYYKILNLQVGAPREEVEKAYRDLVAKWKNNDFALKEIHEAYQNIIQTKTLEDTIEHNYSSRFKPFLFFFGILTIIIGILISLPNSIPTRNSAQTKSGEPIPQTKSGEPIPTAMPIPTENEQEQNIRIVKLPAYKAGHPANF